LNSQKTESQTALDFFAGLITIYQVDLETARTNLKNYVLNHPAPVRGDRPFLEQFEIEYLNSEITNAKGRYSNAVSKEEDAKLSLQQVETNIHQTYVVIDAPEIPIKPNRSLRSMAIQVGIFLGIGLLISLVLIYVSSVMDSTVRFPLDITAHTELPVLAVVPDTLPQKNTPWIQNLSLPGQKSRSSPFRKLKTAAAHTGNSEE
jgi:hypothetical protein